MTIRSSVSLLVFVGGFHGSAVEEMIAGAHQAIALDTIERAQAAGVCSEIVLLTDSADLAAQAAPLGVRTQVDTSPFHFGQRLRQVIHDYHVERPFYIGGGSAPLLTVEELRAIAEKVTSSDNVVIANNPYSADFVAFTPGTAIDRIEPPLMDNNLARLLKRQAGLSEVALPRSLGTMLDVDTPTDLMVLQVHPWTGARTQRYLAGLDLDVSHIRKAMRFLTDPDAEVLVAGRVGSAVWAHLETETACRVRLLSEERGMRADGREETGRVYTILGFYLQEVGMTRFFQTLGKMGQAVFLDSRPLFHHFRLNLSAPDRFYSDLRQPEKIQNPFCREFTAAAIQAPVPVVLGGHTTVAGGLWAIIDAAWQERDREQGLPGPNQARS